MLRVCAWCQHLLQGDHAVGKKLTDDQRKNLPKDTTHGMCLACSEEMMSQIDSPIAAKAAPKQESFREWAKRKDGQ